MASKIAAHFRRSTAAAAAVGRFVTHVKTRFNSYLLCVESIVKHFSKLKSHLAVLPAGEDELKNYVGDLNSAFKFISDYILMPPSCINWGR